MNMEGSFLVPWQIKAADEQGVLMGIANVMDYIDFGGDKVMPGAFNKTLKDHDGVFPLEMDHGKGLSEEIGVAYLAVRGDALVLERGELNMSSARVRDEVYPLLKFRMEKGLPAGLSINYRIPKGGAKFLGSGVRELSEIALRKVGVVDEPMNDKSMITDVKGAAAKSDGAAAFYKSMAEEVGMEPTGFVPDFASEMADMNEELITIRRQLIEQALCNVLWSLIYNADMTPADKTAQAADAIAAHGDEMKSWFAEALNRESEAMKAARDDVEVKAGRILSKKNENMLREAHAMHMEAGKKIDGVLSQLDSAKSITAPADEPGENQPHSDQAAGDDGVKDVSGLAADFYRRQIGILRKP